MPQTAQLPHRSVRRAAVIARGPHACPHCECPTWTEPPVPWTDLRDFVVRCDACERPITVRIDRDRIMHRGAVPTSRRAEAGVDAVDELLDTRGATAFALRLLAASTFPIFTATLAFSLGATILASLAVAAIGVVPAALWMPALVAAAASSLRGSARSLVDRLRRHSRQQHGPRETIEVVAGRWDQWLHEEKVRARDRAEFPEVVLVELERVLDERELRRVRLLAERGEVPAGHLEDLLRYRRTWNGAAAATR